MINIWKAYCFTCGCKEMATFFPKICSQGRVCPIHKMRLVTILKPCCECGKIMELNHLGGKTKRCRNCNRRTELQCNRDNAAKKRAEKPKKKKKFRQDIAEIIRHKRNLVTYYRETRQKHRFLYPDTAFIDGVCPATALFGEGE